MLSKVKLNQPGDLAPLRSPVLVLYGVLSAGQEELLSGRDIVGRVRAAFRVWGQPGVALAPEGIPAPHNLIVSEGAIIPLELPIAVKKPQAEAEGPQVVSFRLQFKGKRGSGRPRFAILETEKELEKVANTATVAAEFELGPPPSAAEDPFYLGPHPCELGGIQKQLVSALNYLSPVLVREVYAARNALGVKPSGCVLVHGGSGMGKSTFVKAAASALRTSQASLAHTVAVDCKALLGQKMQTVLGALRRAFGEAQRQAPSLVVLDNIDELCPAMSEEAGAANLQSAEIAETVTKVIYASSNAYEVAPVGVIATASSGTSIHDSLRRSGLFDFLVPLLPPRPAQRTEMLQALTGLSSVPSKGLGGIGNDGNLDWEEMAFLTEGCTPADLVTLVNRARHSAVLRSMESAKAVDVREGGEPPLVLEQDDFTQALNGFEPEALHAARLTKSTVTWADVGGLTRVKRELVEMMEIPVKFRQLFERVSARLPTGALLYGPPGCGKTLVASAVAKECGLNFISIKGPEVLDKYIGASEATIRNLFSRASGASPCLLFFDEFEAVAPRRGSDNTGVTDRVVNQLLTFLDGVEGRTGVYVMGATSRPDMIDPALLRPGRLDLLLYCGFPDAQERLEVLQAVSRRLTMEDGCNEALASIAAAKESEAFTGADLQGMINMAQLVAVHEALGRGEKTAIVLKPDHLHQAFQQTRPSMSVRDRLEFERSHSKFRGSAKFQEPLSATDDGTQRTSLK
ncbi:unnamed protein product [Chrysoparadoxa australica]